MAIITFPAITPTRVTWGLKSLTETFTSPLNGATQTVGRPGARWRATLDFDNLSQDQGRELQAFLLAMDGMSNRVELHNHDRPGVGALPVLVNGAGQVGTSLNIKPALTQAPELISNGTFDADVAGWSVANTGGTGYASTLVATNGEAILTAQGTSGGRWGIPFNTVPGRVYQASVSMRRVSGTGGGGILIANSNALATANISLANTAASSSSTATTQNTRIFNFRATQAVHYLSLYASVNGDVFAFDNASVKETPGDRVFRAGDFFMVNGELKMVTRTVTAPATTSATTNGYVALPFGPMLRASPISDALVTFEKPTALFMLAQDQYAMTRLPGDLYGNTSIELVEVFR